MVVPQLLLDTLKGLSNVDFDEFKWYLSLNILKNCRQIPRCNLESPHRHNTVSKMIESYGEELALNMTVAILRKMKHNNAAEKLQKAHTDGAAAQVTHALVTSSSALGFPSGQRFSIDGASNVISLGSQNATGGKVIISGNVNGNVGGIVGSNGAVIISGNVGGNVSSIVGSDAGGIISGNGSVIISGNVCGNFGGIVGSNVGGIVSSNNLSIIGSPTTKTAVYHYHYHSKK